MTIRKTVKRTGIAAVLTAICLMFILAMVACSFDIGWILMTRTELQAAADGAALAGGTELLPGMGFQPDKTAAQVVAAATPVAVDYASRNPNGNVGATFADGARDVRFGWGFFNTGTGQWEKHWGQAGNDLYLAGNPKGAKNQAYNIVGATLHRDQTSTSNNDRQLPLFIAPAIGITDTNVAALATAVIMPATGFRVPPGSPAPTNVMPFAFQQRLWQKYLRAQLYYETFGIPNPINSVPDNAATYATLPPTQIPPPDPNVDEPLFGHVVPHPSGRPDRATFVQDFTDVYTCNCDIEADTSTVGAGADGLLEVDLYPRDQYTSGNFGTIDIGASNNSTSTIDRQIREGPNASDMAYYPNNTFTLNPGVTAVQGDTGLSAGFKDALDSIIGQCRTVFLFSAVQGPGNNAMYTLEEMAGVRIMHVQLTGSMTYKHLQVQLCKTQLGGGTGDWTNPPGENTTVFTPLILIE